jgi:hypothetical protein
MGNARQEIVALPGQGDKPTDSLDDYCQWLAWALNEPADSPKLDRRMEFAKEHSLDNFAALLSKMLPLNV